MELETRSTTSWNETLSVRLFPSTEDFHWKEPYRSNSSARLEWKDNLKPQEKLRQSPTTAQETLTATSLSSRTVNDWVFVNEAPLLFLLLWCQSEPSLQQHERQKKLLVWGEKEQIIECWKEEEEEEEKKRERRWFGNKLVRSVGKPPDAIHVWKELSRVVVFLFPPRRERRSAGNYQRLATHNIIVARPF